MRKLKQGDEVIVIAGKNKGERGKIQRCVAANRVIVSGINIVKKHQKPNPQKGVKGGIVEKEAPLDISNIAIINPTTDTRDRVGFKFIDGKKKVRIFKSNGQIIGATKKTTAS